MTYTCQRCCTIPTHPHHDVPCQGYTWTGRTPEQNRPKPVACPSCMSRKWDEPRKE